MYMYIYIYSDSCPIFLGAENCLTPGVICLLSRIIVLFDIVDNCAAVLASPELRTIPNMKK